MVVGPSALEGRRIRYLDIAELGVLYEFLSLLRWRKYVGARFDGFLMDMGVWAFGSWGIAKNVNDLFIFEMHTTVYHYTSEQIRRAFQFNPRRVRRNTPYCQKE